MWGKKIILIIILPYFLSCIQKNKTNEINQTSTASSPPILQIYLKEFDVYFFPDKCKGKELIELLGDIGKLDADIADCKGKMKIRQFTKSGTLLVEGQYINSLDTLKKYSIGKSAIDGSRHLSVMEYFQPLPDGVWVYYVNGKESVKKIYKEGILLN